MRTRTSVLENGINVAVYPFPGLETVGIAIGVRYGSVDENPRINGSAHFLEHMMFKGTKKRTWKDIREETKAIGAYQNAFTDREMTMYIMQAYKKYAGESVEMLADMLQNSVLPEKEFELERGPIINENLLYEDNPSYLFSDYMPRVLFEKHPAKMPVGGNNETTIKKITREHLFEIYKRNYAPENMVIAISGGIDYRTADALVKKHFGRFERTYSRPRREVANEKQKRKDLVIDKKGLKQTRIGIGFKCREFDPKRLREYAGMTVLNALLNYRVYEEVREKRGLSYDPSSSYNSYATFGFIAAECGVEPKKAGTARSVMLKEFERLQNGEIGRDEVDKMKNSLRINYITRRERSLDFATVIANSGLIANDFMLSERLPDLVRSVTLDDVREYAHAYIDVDRYGMVMLRPK